VNGTRAQLDQLATYTVALFKYGKLAFDLCGSPAAAAQP